MHLKARLACAALCCAAAGAATAAKPTFKIAIDPAKELGPIRIMNAVNNGPIKGYSDQTVFNFDTYKALKIPYARVHDASLCYAYGAEHTVDIHAVFPDFDKDENDPANYDFTLTDNYLATMREAGTEPYYRLGASIEHWIKKYHVNPPKDFAKWARICEHVVRHYNEGWANGYKWNIKYWEIWNEADNCANTPDGRPSPTWTGTKEQFLELYKVASLHLRKCFGETIKIGGPAFCWAEAWKEDFLPFCAREKLPLDFYSYHSYRADPEEIGEWTRKARKMLDENGFIKAETHLNEWNYVAGWSDEWVYSLDVMSGSRVLKGAAFIAATMSICQDGPLDMLMYYDARVHAGMNAIFKGSSLAPNLGYWPFIAWRNLRDLGTQVSATVADAERLYVTAAKNGRGDLGLLATRYTDNDRDIVVRTVEIALPQGYSWDQARFHLTGEHYVNSEIYPLIIDGKAQVRMDPNSFLYVDWRR